MQKNSRILAAAGILMILAVVPLFANGQKESTRLSGMVASIQPSTTPNMVTVVLNNKSGNVTVTVSQSVVAALSLKVGQSVNVNGVLHVGKDGAESIDASDVSANGKTLQVAQGETTLPQAATKEAEQDSPTHGPKAKEQETEKSGGAGSSGDN